MQNKWELSNGEKVCGIDIDGVLNYYPYPWVKYINDSLGTGYLDLNEAKGAIPYQVYRNLKYHYRESGIKASLTVREGAQKLLAGLKERGYIILIITSRPFNKHKTLYKQTIDWLNNNKLAYDGLIFGEDKYIQILSSAPNLRFMIEDHRYYANLISQWGYRVFLINNPYNKGTIEKNVKRIIRLEEVLDYE